MVDQALATPFPAAAAERLRLVAERLRPVTLAGDQTLPVAEPLAPLFPRGSLRRGITIGLSGPGATSLALALVAEPTRRGSWAAFVGAADLGWMTAAEVGVALERVAVLMPGPAEWAATVAALIGAFDLVVLTAEPGLTVRAGDARRLMARARERGSVLVALKFPAWPERPDLELDLEPGEWQGLGSGHGYLHARRLVLAATGRRDLSRPRQLTLAMAAAGATRLDLSAYEKHSDVVAQSRHLVP